MSGEHARMDAVAMFGLMAFIMLHSATKSASAAAVAPQPPATAHTPWTAARARAPAGRILARIPLSSWTREDNG